MHQIKEMLKKMGFEIVADETKTIEWAENNGFFVATKNDIYYRVDYAVNIYNYEPTIISVREVLPQRVTKVEYI